MRTETPSPLSVAYSLVRGPLEGLRRVAPGGVVSRIVLGAGIAALAALLYAATFTSTPAHGLLRSGERFSADSLLTVGRALDAKGVHYRVNNLGQVEVSASRLEEANVAIAKLDIGPRSLAEIEQRAATPNVWDTPAALEQRKEQSANETLAEMIRPMEGIVSAFVRVRRPKPRGLRPLTDAAAAATAFVWVETENGRELTSATVESIQALIAGAEPDVKHDAVTVCDRKGRVYVDARNPSLGDRNRTRTYRDELRQEISNSLDWLTGAQVSVQVTPPPQPPLSQAPSPVASAANTTAQPPATVPAHDATTGVTEPVASVGVNQPLDLAPDPVPPPAPAPAPVAPAPAAPAAVELTGPPRVKVWVQVPRSFYVKAVGGKETSLDDLKPLIERTKVSIETAVKHLVPTDQLDEVVISTIPDELPVRQLEPLQDGTGLRRDLSLWVPIGVAAGATVVSLVLALRLFTTRRPAVGFAANGRNSRGRYKIDEGSDTGPGPSERVRELIRHDPEAAASVLNRWTQGGTIG